MSGITRKASVFFGTLGTDKKYRIEKSVISGVVPGSSVPRSSTGSLCLHKKAISDCSDSCCCATCHIEAVAGTEGCLDPVFLSALYRPDVIETGCCRRPN